MITVEKQFIRGADVDGQTHKDFVMRPATIADAIAAVEKAGENPSSLRMRVFKAAEQIVKLGELNKDQITGELLLSLPDDDVEPLFEAQDAVEKKRNGLKSNSSPTPKLK